MTGKPFPHSSAFAGDDGSTDPALAAAFRAEDRLAAVVEALRTARVLIPVVAGIDEWDEPATEGGLAGEKSAHAAMVTVQAPDGRAALPVFSSVAAMAAWRDDARPVPVEGRRAALAAGSDADALVVVDPGSDHTVLVTSRAVEAIATGEPWRNPLHDEQVRAAVGEALAPVPHVRHATLQPGEGAEVRIVLALAPGLDRVAVINASQHASAALAAVQVLTERVDSLEIRVTTAKD